MFLQIKEIIRQGVEVPEGQNDLRRMQLRELALLNGTLRENEGPRCSNCGASDHKSWMVCCYMCLLLCLNEIIIFQIIEAWLDCCSALTSQMWQTTLYVQAAEELDILPGIVGRKGQGQGGLMLLVTRTKLMKR